jgi:hypothetical protein
MSYADFVKAMHSELPDRHLLTVLRERRQEISERVARGQVRDLTGADGYWAMTGRVNQLDEDIRQVEEILFGRKTPERDPSEPNRIATERYGVGV